MMPKVVAAKKHLLALRSDVDIDDYIAHGSIVGNTWTGR